MNLIQELSRMKNLFVYEKGRVISEQKLNEDEDPFATAAPCLSKFKTAYAATGTASGGPNKFGVPYKIGVKNLENYTFELDNSVWRYGQKTNEGWSCNSNGTINVAGQIYNSDGTLYGSKPKTQQTTQQGTQQGTQQSSQISIPNLKTPQDIQKFQDWLDENKAGWAWGYPQGKLNKGKGYGRLGPRTKKAWDLYGEKEYLKPEVQPSPISQEEIKVINSPEPTKEVETPKIDPAKVINAPVENQKTGGLSPDIYYERLVELNLIDPLTDESGREYNRIKFKGDPDQKVIEFLDGYLSGKGYQRLKQKTKGYGVKIVWVKK